MDHMLSGARMSTDWLERQVYITNSVRAHSMFEKGRVSLNGFQTHVSFSKSLLYLQL